MPSILYKWFLLISIWIPGRSFAPHPVYLSVIEIEHNAKDQTLEISCKIFTDDFEKALRAAYNTHVDLIKASDKAAMDKLVSDYVRKHLLISINGKKKLLRYEGYEAIDEGVYSYFQADDVPFVKSMTVIDNVLYEYQSQQMSFIHVTVNGKRQSTKLVNPEEKVEFSY